MFLKTYFAIDPFWQIPSYDINVSHLNVAVIHLLLTGIFFLFKDYDLHFLNS